MSSGLTKSIIHPEKGRKKKGHKGQWVRPILSLSFIKINKSQLLLQKNIQSLKYCELFLFTFEENES